MTEPVHTHASSTRTPAITHDTPATSADAITADGHSRSARYQGAHYPDLRGQLVLITGAAGGIGQAVTLAFAAQGARLALLDAAPLPAALLQALAALPAAPLWQARVALRDAGAIAPACAQLQAQHGCPDALVHVAGVLQQGSVAETDMQAWRDCFAVNCDAVFLLSRAFAPAMQARGSGSIVTVSSNAARVPRQQMAAYAAAKAAASQFTRCLGLELAPAGIRCNLVSPGSTATPMLYGMGVDDAACIAGNPARFKCGIPLGKVAQGADVAQAVLYLTSRVAGHVSMQDIVVDGGATLAA